jgi:DNA-binding NtrC family response regulator
MTTRRSIFYFDDDPAQLEVFREMFGDDYDVLTSDDLDAALLVLAECSPEIIISDQLMPLVKGTEFLRAAAEVCPGSVRVLLSGQVSLGEVMSEVASGTVQLFISKPWREAEMRDALERAGALADSLRRRGDSPPRPPGGH